MGCSSSSEAPNDDGTQGSVAGSNGTGIDPGAGGSATNGSGGSAVLGRAAVEARARMRPVAAPAPLRMKQAELVARQEWEAAHRSTPADRTS